jgi:thiol-disulfide isomerase/thioredoxin
MKFFFLCCCFFTCSSISAQTVSPNEVYKKIEAYYSKNPSEVDLFTRVTKNALAYDTFTISYVFIRLDKNTIFVGQVNESIQLDSGWVVGHKIYEMNPAEKENNLLLGKREVPYQNTLRHQDNPLPPYNSTRLEKKYGKILSVKIHTDELLIVTKKYLLSLDPASFRINSAEVYQEYHGRLSYGKFIFVDLEDSCKKILIQKARQLVQDSKNYTYITEKERKRNYKPPPITEGKIFSFKNLASFNNGQLDSAVQGKYVILNFFDIACHPCFEATNEIWDWLAKIDTSKVLMVGVDKYDQQSHLEMYMKDWGFDFPIITGDQAKQIVDNYSHRIFGFPSLFFITPEGKIEFVKESTTTGFLLRARKYVKK